MALKIYLLHYNYDVLIISLYKMFELITFISLILEQYTSFVKKVYIWNIFKFHNFKIFKLKKTSVTS